jgi:hypothetical protein
MSYSSSRRENCKFLLEKIASSRVRALTPVPTVDGRWCPVGLWLGDGAQRNRAMIIPLFGTLARRCRSVLAAAVQISSARIYLLRYLQPLAGGRHALGR